MDGSPHPALRTSIVEQPALRSLLAVVGATLLTGALNNLDIVVLGLDVARQVRWRINQRIAGTFRAAHGGEDAAVDEDLECRYRDFITRHFALP